MENTEKLLEEPISITATDIANMKVSDLRRELKVRSLSTVGNKPELIERLQAFITKGFDILESAEEVNEDEVLGDVNLLTTEDNKSSQEISEEEILGASVLKDDIEDPLGTLLEEKPKEIPIVKTKITLSRGVSVPSTLSPSKPETVVVTKSPITLVAASKENHDVQDKMGKLSTEERLALRSKKFNQPLPTEAKLKMRIERFGLPQKTAPVTTSVKSRFSLSTTTKTPADVEKLKIRAKRFGQIVATDLKQVEDKEKLLKRKARFATETTTTSTLSVKPSSNDEEMKKRRAERFKTS